MLRVPAGWVVRASADNALGTASKAGVSGKTHVVHSVTAAFSVANAGKLLTIKDGTTVVFSTYVHNAVHLVFPGGILITNGAACSAELAASGTGAQLGDVSLHGVTV